MENPPFWLNGEISTPKSKVSEEHSRSARIRTVVIKPTIRKIVGWDGLEPSTNALKGRCSTIELPTQLILWIKRDRFIDPRYTADKPYRFG